MPLRNVLIVAISIAISLACYSVAAKNRYANLFGEAVELIDTEALEQVPHKQLFSAAMSGMVKDLDPHSAYISGEDYANFTESLQQEFGGVGMYVETNPETNRLFILTPVPDTPAFAAGLTVGDEILSIDDKNADGMDRSEAVKLLRGPIGQPVELLIERKGERFTVELIRAAIKISSLNGDLRRPDGSWQYMLADHPHIAYLRLTQFGEKSADEVETVLNEIADDTDGLILDLRNNSGGLLNAAIRICDFFIDKDQVIVSTRSRKKNESTFSKTIPLLQPDIPMVVLINRHSASASEIVAGCLQDHHRAVVIGEQSWGKGTVQNVIPMQRGKSALKLTTASYWRPSGRQIDRYDPASQKTKVWGVQPNPGFQIEMTEEDVFENLRRRSFRDIQGLIPPENEITSKALKNFRFSIEQNSADDNDSSDGSSNDFNDNAPIDADSIQSNEDADADQPATDTPDQLETKKLEDRPREETSDGQPHVDQPLQRAIEYLQNVLTQRRIAA